MRVIVLEFSIRKRAAKKHATALHKFRLHQRTSVSELNCQLFVRLTLHFQNLCDCFNFTPLTVNFVLCYIFVYGLLPKIAYVAKRRCLAKTCVFASSDSDQRDARS